MSKVGVRRKLQAILEVCVMQELLNVVASNGPEQATTLHEVNMEQTLDKLTSIVYEERVNSDT